MWATCDGFDRRTRVAIKTITIASESDLIVSIICPNAMQLLLTRESAMDVAVRK